MRCLLLLSSFFLIISASASASASATVIGNFPGWAAYRDESTLLSADTRALDVLVYSSAVLDQEGQIRPSDDFPDLYIEHVAPNGDVVFGNYAAVAALKARQPDLDVLLSIGGWTGSTYISSVLANQNSRDRFIQSWQSLHQSYGFDGIELDWQHPLDGGAEGNTNSPNDLQNLLQFAQQFKASCSECHLAITLGPGAHVREGWPFRQLNQYVDWYILHAAAFNGTWNQNTGHISPLFANEQRPTLSINRAVQQLIGSGLASHQLIIQTTTVGSIWQDVAAVNSGLYQASSEQKAFGTWDNEFTGATGAIAFREVIAKDDGWQVHWDDQAKASYLYQPQTRHFISYESQESLRQKLAYIDQYNLAGIGFWDIQGDSSDGLVATAHQYWQPWQGFGWRLLDDLQRYRAYILSAILVLMTLVLSRYYWRRYQQIRIDVIFHQQWHIWLQQVPQQLAALAYLVNDAKPANLTLPSPLTEGAARLAHQIDAMVDDPWQRLAQLSDQLVAPWQADELVQQLTNFLHDDQRVESSQLVESEDLPELSAQQFQLEVGVNQHLLIQCTEPLSEELRRYLSQLQSMVKVARVNAGRLLDQPQLLNELGQIACRRDKIVYIKAEKGYSGIYADDLKRPEFITTRLRYLAIHFPSFFIAPHRSYLVPVDRIEGAVKRAGKYFLLVASEEVPVARGQLPELKRKYPHWFAQTLEQAA